MCSITVWAIDCRWEKRGEEMEVWTVEVENCRWVDVYDSRWLIAKNWQKKIVHLMVYLLSDMFGVNYCLSNPAWPWKRGVHPGFEWCSVWRCRTPCWWRCRLPSACLCCRTRNCRCPNWPSQGCLQFGVIRSDLHGC